MNLWAFVTDVSCEEVYGTFWRKFHPAGELQGNLAPLPVQGCMAGGAAGAVGEDYEHYIVENVPKWRSLQGEEVGWHNTCGSTALSA